MNSLLLKYFTYMIILFSTFIAHSDEAEDFITAAKQNPLVVVQRFNEQKMRDSEVFSKNIDKQAFINNFITTHPPKKDTSIKADFLDLYVNNPSFREWFYRLQTYITLKYVIELPEESLTDFKQPLLEESVPSSWSKFYDIYIHNISFYEWVFQFQRFIMNYDATSDKMGI